MDVGENSEEETTEEESPKAVVVNKDTLEAATNQDFASNSNTTASSTLPEIEFDFGDDNFLVDPDQLHSVFDYSNHRGGEEQEDVDDDIQSSEEHPEEQLLYPPPEASEEEFLVDEDLETDQLYQELANMSLNDQKNVLDGDGPFEDPFVLESETMQHIPTGNDGLPFYFWCQPCDVIGDGEAQQQQQDDDEFQRLDPVLPPISENNPLDEQEVEIV
ncbi:MAG: hypothetical protein SGARI_005386, partial [Bacillariaceae sp.]